MEAEFCLVCGDMLKAIEIMDKSFRPVGAAAKSDAAFTIHEVCMCI